MRRPYFAKTVSAKRPKNTGVKQTEKSGSHRVFGRFSALKQKMNGKTGWSCYEKKSGCDILYKKMKSKNVSLVLKFIPVRGRKPFLVVKLWQAPAEIYPREGTETISSTMISYPLKAEIYPREGTETKTQINNHLISLVEIYPREGTETLR